MGGIGRKIVTATLVAGTLDILSAVVYQMAAGRPVANMLRFVASGPMPDAMKMGTTGALIGLVVHFVLMAVMVTVFVVAASRLPILRTQWVIAGIAYGLGLWLIMNFIVLPVRFGPLPLHALVVAEQLFSHIVLVGLPIAWFARR